MLDIGCGSGAYDRRLADMGHNIVGIDYSEYVIKGSVEKLFEKNVIFRILDKVQIVSLLIAYAFIIKHS